MNIATIGGQTLNSNYSADFQAVSGDYLGIIPNNIATVFEGDPITVTLNAPYGNVVLAPISNSDSTQFDGATAVSIEFSDILNNNIYMMPYNTFVSLSAAHVYTNTGIYKINLTIYTNTNISEYFICNIIVNDIPPWPNINVFNLDQTTFAYSPSAILLNPYTLQFSASGTQAGSFPLERLIWDFGDNSDLITISKYDTTGDIREQVVSHIYNRSTLSQSSTALVTLSAVSTLTDTVSSIIVEPIGPFSLSSAGTRNLIKSRMFGPDNNLLLIFEDSSSKFISQQIISL